MSKIAYGITDSTVSMACKAHLRNNSPVVIAISTNDALAGNAKNLGIMLNTKNVYFVPFGQDNAINKPTSLVADFDLILNTSELALDSQQIQPILVPL